MLPTDSAAVTVVITPSSFTVVIPERRASYEIDLNGKVRNYFDGTNRFAVGDFVLSKQIPAILDDTPGVIVHIRVKDEDRERICGALMALPMAIHKNIHLTELLQTLFAPPGTKHIIVHFRGEGFQCCTDTPDLALLPTAPDATTK